MCLIGFISISLTAHFLFLLFLLAFFVCFCCCFCFVTFFFFLNPTADKVNKKNFIDDNDVSIYKTKRTISTSLFTAATRPPHIQKLYEKAAPTPVLLACNGDTSSENNFSVCPSVGHTRRQITKKIDAEIETRVVSIMDSALFIHLLYDPNAHSFNFKAI